MKTFYVTRRYIVEDQIVVKVKSKQEAIDKIDAIDLEMNTRVVKTYPAKASSIKTKALTRKQNFCK